MFVDKLVWLYIWVLEIIKKMLLINFDMVLKSIALYFDPHALHFFN